MRALAIVLGLGTGLAACGDPYPGPPYGGPYPDGGFGNPGPGFGAPCKTTADCTGDQVCARDDECIEPTDAHSVLIRWTIGGAPPTTTSCAPLGELTLQFTDVTGGGIGYAPLMCTEGQFFIDVWPVRYTEVAVENVATTGSPTYFGQTAIPSGSADVSVDMEPQQ